MLIKKENLVNAFIDAVQKMRETHCCGTYYWIPDADEDGNNWAIVLGWSDGFDEDPNDNNLDGAYRICAKVAYQPSNSLLQCDYDLDWLMPYNEATMEVDDNEISIYPDTDLKDVVDWLLECYKKYNEI